MFCHLFVLSECTKIPVSEFESCSDKCKFKIDVKSGDKPCSLTTIKNEKLSKDHFGWMIERMIFFDKNMESKSKNTIYISAISMIHPSEADSWIIFLQRKNKKTDEWLPYFKFFKGNENKEFESLTALNVFLKKCKYDGRSLTENDFLVNGGVPDVHN